MSTTTIRLSDDLKKRIAKAAVDAGTSSHAFIIEAIQEGVEAAEQRSSFYATAETRFDGIADTGKAIPWRDMRNYLLDLASGKKTPRPKPKKISR